MFHLPWHLQLHYPRLQMPFQIADRVHPEERGKLVGSTPSRLETSKTVVSTEGN